MFALHARVRQKGIGFNPRRRHPSINTGAIARHTMSFDSNALRPADTIVNSPASSVGERGAAASRRAVAP